MTAWQIDFKNVTTVSSQREGKRQVIEIFNVVDIGTSIWVGAHLDVDYHAETVLLALTETFLVHGLPQSITYDRDPRFVGSWKGRDFPSALTRFLLCLGIQVSLCPPRRPDLNAFVERFHRTLEYECLCPHKPVSLDATYGVINDVRVHYNQERPNQAISCANRPPYVAFPQLPALPRLPDWIDPDNWLHAIHNTRYKR